MYCQVAMLASCFFHGWLASLPTLPFILPVFSLVFQPSCILSRLGQSDFYYQSVRAIYIHSVQEVFGSLEHISS